MPESPLPYPAPRPPSRPTGARRVSLDMRMRLDQADRFTGVPRGTAKPLRFLHAFREAEPYLGLPAHAYKLVAWLVEKTEPQDWEEGSRPIAWPAARSQQEFLVLSAPRVKHLNRVLCEAGIFAMRDNEQGKRWGRRDPKTRRIIEAYGFDLSLLALRYDEFVKLAAEARLERERMRKLRRRATLARRAIRQAGEELAAQEAAPPQWATLAREAADIAAGIRQVTRSDELGLAVKALESRQQQAEAWLRQLIKPVETNPEGLENEPLQYTTTTLTPHPNKDTVIARQGSSRGADEPVHHDPSPSEADRLFPQRMGLGTAQLVELAPRLEPYLPRGAWGWREIVEAAYFLTADLGISKTLWARACQLMGRNEAAITLAVVSTHPPEYFTSGPGGYFAGMVRKFEKGELNLDRTLWKLRGQKWGQEGRRRAAGRA